MLNILKFLVPHFITRCLVFNTGQLMGIYRGGVTHDQLIIETAAAKTINTTSHVLVCLGISWLGRVIFFWKKSSFVHQKPQA